MTPYEWQKVVYRVRTIWGSVAGGKWDGAERAYRDTPAIQRGSLSSFMAALGSFESQGMAWPPSISQVIASAVGPSYGSERPEPAMCTHPTISVLGEEEMCAVCLETWERGTRLAATVSE